MINMRCKQCNMIIRKQVGEAEFDEIPCICSQPQWFKMIKRQK
jgi:hypothetical protein